MDSGFLCSVLSYIVSLQNRGFSVNIQFCDQHLSASVLCMCVYVFFEILGHNFTYQWKQKTKDI